MAVDDALEAEGCFLNLKMTSEEWAGRSWRDWLEQEVEEDGTACEANRGTLYKIGEATGFLGAL